jgi:hypothetical protein
MDHHANRPDQQLNRIIATSTSDSVAKRFGRNNSAGTADRP